MVILQATHILSLCLCLENQWQQGAYDNDLCRKSQQMAQPAEGFDETKKYNLWNLFLLAPGANVITALPERVVCYLILF